MRSLHCRQGILFLLAESISYHNALVSKNKSEAAAAFLVSDITKLQPADQPVAAAATLQHTFFAAIMT